MAKVVTKVKATIRARSSALRVDCESLEKMRQGLRTYSVTRERERTSMEMRRRRAKPRPTVTKIGRMMVVSMWMLTWMTNPQSVLPILLSSP